MVFHIARRCFLHTSQMCSNLSLLKPQVSKTFLSRTHISGLQHLSHCKHNSYSIRNCTRLVDINNRGVLLDQIHLLLNQPIDETSCERKNISFFYGIFMYTICLHIRHILNFLTKIMKIFKHP
jgi:hypothetical protein